MFLRCHLAAAAARLRTLNRAVPAQLGVVPAVQHGSRELCTGLPKWRLRNKKIIGKSTGVYGSKINTVRDVPGGYLLTGRRDSERPGRRRRPGRRWRKRPGRRRKR